MNAKSGYQLRLLTQAIDNQNAQGVRQLLAQGAEDEAKGMAIIYAARRRQKEIIELLLSSGADINAKDSDGMNALMMASANGYDDIVTLLVEKGADVKARNRDGMGAMKYASDNNNVSTTELLRKYDAV